MTMAEAGYPPSQGLYDPALEHDSCGFGFVADIKGRPSHEIVVKALEVLLNLEHRGATGAEKDTGDGAGILLQTPHAFLASECEKLGLALPGRGRYGVGMVFLPPSEVGREAIGRLFQETVRGEGQELLGWRDVPTDNAALGPTAKASQPVIRQIFIGRGPDVAEEPASPATGGARMRGASEEEPASPATGGARMRGASEEEPASPATGGARTRGASEEEPASPATGGARTRGAAEAEDAFERKLYVIRRLVEKKVSRSAIPGRSHFYVPSLSHKTVVYKGMLNASQLRRFYLDLQDPAVVS